MMENLEDKIKEQKKRAREKRIIILAFIALIIATIVQGYYAKITFNNTPLPSNIIVFSLLNINIILILLLIFLIFRNLVKIFFSKEQKKIKKLSRKLVISFFLFTTVPLILQFVISSVIVKSSITGWFNKKVEDNLEASLKIADKYYQEKRGKILTYTKTIYDLIKHQKKLEDKVKYFYINGYILGKDNEIYEVKYFPEHIKKFIEPNLSKLKAFIINSHNTQGTDIVSVEKKEIIYGYYKGKNYFVIAYFLTGRDITKSSKTISQNIAEYSYLKLMKNPIEKMYLLSLLIVTMVIIFSATWFGFFIAKDITTPINELVKATYEVSKGNLDLQIKIKSQDEIKLLVESFQKMLEELKISRKNLLERQQYIETIINNVNSGVISIDKKGIINTINAFVENLLNISNADIIGLHYKNLKNETLKKIIIDILDELADNYRTTTVKNINIQGKENEVIMLSIFATTLKGEDKEVLGYLLVMSDLTQVTIAQRTAAWKEVARRVAHEIKNPLTPIQLSAQRLKKKYSNKLTSEKEEFEKTINNIVIYVDVIRNLVNEFSNLAKMPDTKIEAHNLNEIIKELMPFFIDTWKNILFNFVLEDNIPKIHVDKKQIYQVITNILNNSVQSFENVIQENKEITIITKYNKNKNCVRLSIIDNGSGIDRKIKNKIFTPYFSTKKTGTGIGLTIVKSIIDSHNGEITVKNNKPNGTIVEISLPVA